MSKGPIMLMNPGWLRYGDTVRCHGSWTGLCWKYSGSDPRHWTKALDDTTNRSTWQSNNKTEFDDLVQWMKKGKAMVVLRKVFLYQKNWTVDQEVWIKDKSDGKSIQGVHRCECVPSRCDHLRISRGYPVLLDIHRTQHRRSISQSVPTWLEVQCVWANKFPKKYCIPSLNVTVGRKDDVVGPLLSGDGIGKRTSRWIRGWLKFWIRWIS
jgi:hypothetical protein